MTAQVVNLLSADLLPKREWLLFDQCVAVATAWLVILLAFSGYQWFQTEAANAEAEGIQERLARLRELKTARDEAVPLAQLRERVSELQAASQHNTRLLANLSGASADGFAVYLRGLSEARVKGLWLERIDVRIPPGERPLIGLDGKANETHLVPDFLNALTNVEVFEGHRFTDLLIAAGERAEAPRAVLEGPHDFSVSTKARPPS